MYWEGYPMKQNCCDECQQEIDKNDFFMESKSGKICSDCLVMSGAVEAENAHLFKLRGSKAQNKTRLKEQPGAVLTLPLKEAL